MFAWTTCVISLIGAAFNVRKYRFGFVLWMISNTMWLTHNISNGEYAAAVQFGAFLGLSVYGFFVWGGNEKCT